MLILSTIFLFALFLSSIVLPLSVIVFSLSRDDNVRMTAGRVLLFCVFFNGFILTNHVWIIPHLITVRHAVMFIGIAISGIASFLLQCNRPRNT